jgi:exonuclease SbcC
MRLHQLSVSAFGPFAGTERVDFDALSAAGIFLFSGPTGSGKTSVLDAVCFALYGQVPGARQQSRSVRSDHAVPGARPEVVLEVTLRGRRLRITRSPQWDRPKRRGSGTTVEQAKVLVEETDGAGWRTLSTRLDEAGHLLGGLLGLTLAQFCQVVLLPQGQFADFLRADADKRRALLETLFDTSRFADVEQWLVRRRQTCARSLDEVDRAIGQLLARVGEAAGADLPDDSSTDGSSSDHSVAAAGTTWVDRLLAEAVADRDDAVRREKAAATAATRAVAAVGTAEQVVALQEKSAALQARRADLDAARPQRDAAVAELEAARLVAPLMPMMEQTAQLQLDLEAARARAAASTAVLAPVLRPVLAATGTSPPVAPTLWDGGSFPSAALVSRVSRSARDEAGTLGHLVGQERELDELARGIDLLQRRSVELSALSDKAARWLETAGDRRARLADARDAARAAEAGLPEAQAASTRAAGQLAAAARRDELTTQVAATRDLVREAVDTHQVSRDALQSVREARLAGMAAELAGSLHDGDDCPVCGSTEHPRPASDAATVTKADEDAAAGSARAAEVRRREVEQALGALKVQLAEARAAAGGDTSAADLIRLHDELRGKAADLAATAASATAAEAALAGFDQERETQLRAGVALDADARAIAAEIQEQQQRAAGLLAELTSARGDDPSVAERVDRLQRQADALDGLAETLSGVEALESRLADAHARLDAAIRDRGLDSVDAVVSAARDEDRCAALDELRRRHDAEQVSVEEQLAAAELVSALAEELPDLDTLRLAAGTAERSRDEAVARAAAARARAVALRRLAADLRAAATRRAPVAEEHRVVDGLSRLAEGKSSDNRLRMSLSAYVLAARLEQVALSASERLVRMSSGRYSLLHTDVGGSGRARGGLALRVLDAWTGLERDPATLSGGEAFSASLALALGLADVVTAEAGGALLETLFVDEGFGSLDDDSLEEVMAVLDDLREGGRAVGVVSHVADLRQRIPTQLRVDKTRHGSSLHQ